MARRPSGHYELVENLDRFSLFDEAFSVMTPVAMQRRSFLATAGANAIRTISALLQPISKPSKH